MENFSAHNITTSELITKIIAYEQRKQDLIVPSDQIQMFKEDDKNIFTLTTYPVKFEARDIMHSQIAEKIGIPMAYYRKLMATDPDGLILDNVNKMLARADKNVLLRLYKPESGGVSVGRALLSDKYKRIDHFAVITTITKAIQDAGVNLIVDGCDISERRMSVRFIAPEVKIDAVEYLKNYRNPENGTLGGGVVAGLALYNSETGHSKYVVAPRVLTGACANGQVFMKHADMKRLHLGAKQEVGEVEWSQKTLDKELEWILEATQDCVKEYTSKDFLFKLMDEINEKSARKLIYPFDATVNMCN